MEYDDWEEDDQPKRRQNVSKMPVGSQSKAKARAKQTRGSHRVAKDISKSKGGIRNRRNKK